MEYMHDGRTDGRRFAMISGGGGGECDPRAERFQIASGRTASSSEPAEQMLCSFVAKTSAVELMHFPSAVTAHVTERAV